MKDATDNRTAPQPRGHVDAAPMSRPSGGWWRRLFRHPNGDDLRDAIGGLIDKQEEAGEVPATRDELVLLRNILNLHGLTVHDVMVPRADIVSVDIDVSLPDLVHLMSEQAHSRIPVYRGTLDDIEG